jgi:Type I phosphodiesterase / nucleotide pyrophosphatase
MNIHFIRTLVSLTALAFMHSVGQAQQPPPPLKTKHVFLLISDGLRWQEVFTGAEKDLIATDHGGNWASKEYLQKEFWRDTPEERRKALFPFIWTVIAKEGQIYGNQTKGSVARVTNGLDFSYPGYNEMLAGYPDPRINSNEYGPNPNVTVFEWLNNKPEFHDQVHVFATWEVFKNIFNQPRSHIPMQVAWDIPYKGASLSEREKLLNELYRTTTKLDNEDVYDSFLQVPLRDYVKANHPSLLFVGYGETDNWAHSGRYDLMLESARGYDQFVQELWDLVQSLPEYRDHTTFILTADHGRGSGPKEWREHGNKQKGSENIWLAVIGPDTSPLGERSNIAAITQSQIAATAAALLGQDYRQAVPAAAPPITDISRISALA